MGEQMQIYIKPKSGLKIINPVTKRALQPEGELVVSSSYWQRRIADGDVQVQEQKAEKSAYKSEKKSGGDL